MTLWSGRFSEGPDETLWHFTVDRSDRRMLFDDIAGSLAHVGMLASVGVLTADEAETLTVGLESIGIEAEAGDFEYLPSDEDVHTAVERRLGEIVGEAAGKLHTGRSRNDQVSLDLRLYLRRAARARMGQLHDFVAVIAAKGDEAGHLIVPSYTHLQQAQAVPLAHHLLAYAWMLLRDVDRFDNALARIEVSPLGAGASGGSSLPLDPAETAARLEMRGTFENSLDAVASRDFVAEYTFACAQAMVHLSRLAEELILWSTAEYGWVTFSDRHTTGSSALPQKKNPDIAELVRGKSAVVIGNVTTLLGLQKGLPLAYNRDLQEDKRAVFAADDALRGALDALGAMVAAARFHPPPPGAWVTALDLAEILVERGVPFREAHEAVGSLVASLVAAGNTLRDATAEDLVATHPAFEPGDLARIDPEGSVAARVTAGGGSFESVSAQLEALRARL